MLIRFTMALIAIALAAGTAVAETAWRPFKALKLYVSDDVDPGAEVFTAKGHFLVTSSKADGAFLLSPREYTVHAVDGAALDGGEPSVDPAETDDYTLVGVLRKEGATLKWESGDLRFALSHKPPLLGEVSLEALREHTDKYEAAIADYSPDPAALEALRAVDRPTEIVVGFGIWCPICADWLPRLVKSLEAADNENIEATYIAINEGLDRPADVLEANGIDGVPVFIVKRDGEELGRVTGDWLEEAPSPVLERQLVEILDGR